MQIIIYNFEICSTLYKRESNHVLKDIVEFSLVLDSAGLWEGSLGQISLRHFWTKVHFALYTFFVYYG